jgi:hypothetical protein
VGADTHSIAHVDSYFRRGVRLMLLVIVLGNLVLLGCTQAGLIHKDDITVATAKFLAFLK